MPIKGLTTKTVILETAMKIASTHGMEKLSIGELAKAAGMSKSGVFAHFQSKEKLQLDVLERVSGKFLEFVLLPAFKAPRGIPRLQAIFENWLKWHKTLGKSSGGCILISASVEFDDIDGPVRAYIQKTQKDLIDTIAQAAQIAIQEGHFRKDVDTKQFAWSLYSFILGYHHFRRLLNDPDAEMRVRKSFDGIIAYAKAT